MQKIWEGVKSPWGKLLRESNQWIPVVEQNLGMQGQYLICSSKFEHRFSDSPRGEAPQVPN